MIKSTKIIPVNDFAAQQLRMNHLQEQIDDLKANIQKRSPLYSISADSNLIVKTQENYKLVDPVQIIMIQASSNYSTIYLTDGSNILTSKTLKHWQDKIKSNHNFLRIHHSYLINKKHILSFDKKHKKVNLICNRTAVCSRRAKTHFLDKLQEV